MDPSDSATDGDQDSNATEATQDSPLPAWLSLVAGTNLVPGTLLFVVLVGTLIYAATGGLFSAGRLNVDKLKISSSYESFKAADTKWSVTFERSRRSTFSGLVRFAAPIRDRTLRIVTHDILITTGEFADPKIVTTSVTGHMYTYGSRKTANPKGKINLLHTVPCSEEIHRKLRRVRNGDRVTLSGREILDVKAYSQKGKFLGKWEDMGCNTLLVRSVEWEDRR